MNALALTILNFLTLSEKVSNLRQLIMLTCIDSGSAQIDTERTGKSSFLNVATPFRHFLPIQLFFFLRGFSDGSGPPSPLRRRRQNCLYP